MLRNCDVCGREYLAARVTSKCCSSSCRTRLHRAGGAKKPAPVAPAATALPTSMEGLASLVETTQRRLAEVERDQTALGQLALLLAHRIQTGRLDTGSSFASLSKELRATMIAALEGADAEDDPVDELRRRREAKRAG